MAKAIDMRTAAATFFTASQFAVAGASSTPSKFGHRIFAWYLQHHLPAIPLNPSTPTITCQNASYDTVPSPSAVSTPTTTSLSVITPPPVTAKLLQEAKAAGFLSVWLQPGSFTDKELEYALENWPGAAIGGYADGTVGGEGWCVLVDGDTAMEAAKKLTTVRGNRIPASKRQVCAGHMIYSLTDVCSKGGHRVSKQPRKTEPVVGRKARVKKHVLERIGRTENIRIRRVLANLEG
jgi:predicted CoA-binding protein